MATLFRTDGWVKTALGAAIPGAQIYVCNQPANVNAAPPSPLATIFSDVNGLSPITQPIITDGFGHYDFYTTAGAYTIVVAYAGIIQQVYPDQSVGNVSGSSGGGTSLLLEVNGVPAGNQLIANFKGAGGATVSDDGVGGITITSTLIGNPSFMMGAGNFTIPLTLATTSACKVDSALRVYVHKFNTPFPFSFSEASFAAASNLAQGGNVNFGLYNSAGTLLFQSGAIAIPNVAFQNFDVALSPAWTGSSGTYYLAWTFTDTGNTNLWGWNLSNNYVDNSTSSRNLINRNGVVNFGYATNTATASAASLPSTLGALTAASNVSVGSPAILFQ